MPPGCESPRQTHFHRHSLYLYLCTSHFAGYRFAAARKLNRHAKELHVLTVMKMKEQMQVQVTGTKGGYMRVEWVGLC
ncbi:hypothetical protein Y032_0642g1042 [Ancylostoma ceylanicum]|uniref:Uncharacterized protein n=1 Tax=Ancylostoma ceylanicum TaxID=53326 RepID=A0A016WJH8_9BILA|nr:hypothetical protein Y032_0642g1042 [Ancylostoma ceylanicum]